VNVAKKRKKNPVPQGHRKKPPPEKPKPKKKNKGKAKRDGTKRTQTKASHPKKTPRPDSLYQGKKTREKLLEAMRAPARATFFMKRKANPEKKNKPPATSGQADSQTQSFR